MSQSDFANFVDQAREYDPVGFDRALANDINQGTFDFRDVVIEAFHDDQKCAGV